MKITKMAKLAGISIRTLHYYDEIGLLSPSRNKENNRREYTGNDVLKLYQILNHKRMGIPLQQIKAMLNDPHYDSRAAFRQQIDRLEDEKIKIEQQITTIHQLLAIYDADNEVISDNQYATLFATNEHTESVLHQEFWGQNINNLSEKFISSMPPEMQNDISDLMQEKIVELSQLSETDPASKKVQEKIYNFHAFLNQTHGNLYTIENFTRLGRFYSSSETFRAALEDIKSGFSSFMTRAIEEYVKAINNR